MSNHDGGFMLNKFMHRLIEGGIIKNLEENEKVLLVELLRELTYSYDCNWEEIIDARLARFLETCVCCQSTSVEVVDKDGYCDRCKGLR